MDIAAIIIAIVGASQVIYQTWTRYRTEKKRVEIESNTSTVTASAALAEVVDARIQTILDRQDAELKRHQEEIAQLRAEVEELKMVEAELIKAKAYIMAHGLPWPPAPR